MGIKYRGTCEVCVDRCDLAADQLELHKLRVVELVTKDSEHVELLVENFSLQRRSTEG